MDVIDKALLTLSGFFFLVAFYIIFEVSSIQKKLIKPEFIKSWEGIDYSTIRQGALTSLCSVVDVLGAKNRGVIIQSTNNGAFVGAWELEGLRSGFSDTDRLARINLALSNLLRAQTDGTVVQFRYERTLLRQGLNTDIDPNEAHPAAVWLRENRIHHLNQDGIYETRLYAFLWSKAMTGEETAARTKKAPRAERLFFSNLTDYLWSIFIFFKELIFPTGSVSRTLSEHDRAVVEFERLADQFEADLNAICPVSRLGIDQCIQRIREDLNPGDVVSDFITRGEEKTASTQLATSPVEVLGNYLEIGGQCLVAVLTRNSGPGETKPFMFRMLVGGLANTVGDYALVSTFKVENQGIALSELEKRQKEARMAFEASPANINHAAAKQYREIDELVRDAESGAKYLSGALYLRCRVFHDGTLTGRSEARKDIDRMVNSALATFKTLGMNWVRERVDLIPQWQRTLWGTVFLPGRFREFRLLTKHAAHLLCLEKRYHGEKSDPVFLAKTEDRHLFIFSPKDPRHSNSGGIICGMPGSGKSTFMLSQAASLLYWYPKIPTIIIDRGGSAEPLCRVVDGSYCYIDAEKGFVLNPFDHPLLRLGIPPPVSHFEAVTRFYGFLLGIQYGSDDGNRKFTRLREAVATVIYTKIEVQEIPTTRDLFFYLNYISFPQEPAYEQLCRDMADGLREFIFRTKPNERDGTYATLLDKQTHSVFFSTGKSNFAYWELACLDPFPPNIKEALSYLIAYRVLETNNTSNTPDGSRTRRLHIFMDEIWAVLRNNPILKNMLLIDLVRTGRKEGAVIYLCTQNLTDFLGGQSIEEADGEVVTVIQNTAFKFILSQTGNLDSLQHILELTKTETATVSQSAKIQGRYSPVLIKLSQTEEDSDYIRMTLSPVEYWTFTTAPHEREKRAELVQKNITAGYDESTAYRRAIYELSKQYPRGISKELTTQTQKQQIYST